MLVTVFSDASFCSHTKASGWGCYLVSERGRYEGGGQLQKRPASSAVAEGMAAVNSLMQALKSGIADPKDRILLQSDCQGLTKYLTLSRKVALLRSVLRPDKKPSGITVNALHKLKDVPLHLLGDEVDVSLLGDYYLTHVQMAVISFKFQQIVIGNQLDFEFRWVKGHNSKSGTTRSYANQVCDNHAKSFMRAQRKVLDPDFEKKRKGESVKRKVDWKKVIYMDKPATTKKVQPVANFVSAKDAIWPTVTRVVNVEEDT